MIYVVLCVAVRGGGGLSGCSESDSVYGLLLFISSIQSP
jgi:hypothetical protein